MQPQRVLISRDGSDADHNAMQDMPALLQADPRVGDPVRLWTEDGRLLRTSNVRRVERSGSEIVVETMNSRYHLHLPESDADARPRA